MQLSLLLVRERSAALVRGHPVLAFGLACYALAVAGLVGLALAGTEGRFVYIFDDAYIHMAIARSWAEHGVWGLTRYGFTSSTSSPLWTFLIALVFRLIGPHEGVALGLAALGGAAAVAAAYDWVRAWAWRPLWQTVLLVGLSLAGPLPLLALSGMEHTLHVALVLVFVRRVADWAANDDPPGWVWPWLVWASALTLVRLESAFVIAVSGLVLVAARRRWRLAAGLLLAGALPVLLYGLWSQANGWWFLPNSVVVKAGVPDAASDPLALLGPLNPLHLAANLFMSPPLLGVLAAGTLYLLLARRLGWVWDADHAAVVVLVGSLLAHAQFASALWFYRYEAYLLVWAGLALAAVGGRALSSCLAASGAARAYALLTTALLAVVAGLMAYRGALANPLGPRASVNIYQQQLQMARFIGLVSRPGETVVLNDIGAVAFFNDVRVLDIVGLATMETAIQTRAGTLTPAAIAALAEAQGARVAILYPPEAYELHQPRQWLELARWVIPDNVAAGHPEVVIYLIDPAAEADLRAALEAFAPTLPAGIVVK
jgi:hypothetical protein